MKKAKKNGRKKRDSLRFAKFTRLYLQTGNACESMRQAGYTQRTAASHCTDFKRKIKASLEEAARAQGIDETQVIAKYRELLDAKTPKWNEQTKTWDEFEAGNIQLEAVEKLAEILEPRQVTVKAKLEGDNGRPLAIVVINYGVDNSAA